MHPTAWSIPGQAVLVAFATVTFILASGATTETIALEDETSLLQRTPAVLQRQAQAKATVVAPESLWHLLTPEMQHSLAGALKHHDTGNSRNDRDRDALMSSLLHDELDAQYKQHLAKEDELERQLDEQWETARKVQENKLLEEHQHEVLEASRKSTSMRGEELEASRKTRTAERETDRIQHEIDLKNARKQAEEPKPSMDMKFIDLTKGLIEMAKERHADLEKRRVAMEARHAPKTLESANRLLQQVHTELEKATDGWRDAPFWDDFFRTSSAATRLSQLSFSHIEPALRASSLMPEHKVLVLEPKGASLADRLAEEIRSANNYTEATHYGSEGNESKDVVVEVGLLDAMAMCEGSEKASKLGALKSAAARLATLVKPGGTWISISTVPPTLRVPLLGRLAGNMFSLPSEKEDASAGTHTVVLRASGSKDETKPSLSGPDSAQVADMLLYGSEDVHVWAYRMQRGHDTADVQLETPVPSADDGLLDIIRLQRPAPRSAEL